MAYRHRKIRKMRYNVVACNLNNLYEPRGSYDVVVEKNLRYRKAMKLVEKTRDHVTAAWAVLIKKS